jgi:uncharacterized membrane protein YadS
MSWTSAKTSIVVMQIFLLIGWLIGRKFLKVDRDTSYLISSGTAICGGSAIAAVHLPKVSGKSHR